MQQRHDPQGSAEARISALVMPDQVNHLGTLFGGHALGLMDQAAFLASVRVAHRTVVTRALEGIEFRVPVPGGNLVEAVARVVAVGRTSLRVQVELWSEDLRSGERVLATTGHFVMVAVDETGRPVAAAAHAATDV